MKIFEADELLWTMENGKVSTFESSETKMMQQTIKIEINFFSFFFFEI